ncbi:MAG: ABC transporter substrate-binding protein, partial [Spirochaetales bacterium]|nr:ABC transporter substrate-binding protein [Spirochaetales bacterium]
MEKEIYWANLCVLNRKEAEMMEEASSDWKNNHDESYRMVYLGDTEETGIHDRLEKDLSRGKAEFSLLVSLRFDLFCSQKYLYGIREDLEPAGNLLPVRDLVRSSGVMDPDGFFQVLAILPHFILYNRDCLGGQSPPLSLETLLKPSWAGKVYIGNTDLP